MPWAQAQRPHRDRLQPAGPGVRCPPATTAPTPRAASGPANRLFLPENIERAQPLLTALKEIAAVALGDARAGRAGVGHPPAERRRHPGRQQRRPARGQRRGRRPRAHRRRRPPAHHRVRPLRAHRRPAGHGPAGEGAAARVLASGPLGVSPRHGQGEEEAARRTRPRSERRARRRPRRRGRRGGHAARAPPRQSPRQDADQVGGQPPADTAPVVPAPSRRPSPSRRGIKAKILKRGRASSRRCSARSRCRSATATSTATTSRRP